MWKDAALRSLCRVAFCFGGEDAPFFRGLVVGTGLGSGVVLAMVVGEAVVDGTGVGAGIGEAVGGCVVKKP